MIHQGSYSHRITTRALSVTVITVFAAICLFWQGSLIVSEAQRRQTQRRPISNRQKQARDSSIFKHEDHRKNLVCASCHAIRSSAEPDKIVAATKPSANSGYPYHDSCFRCHAQQIYRGNRPVFCTVCHTRVSPRTTAKDIYPRFPRRDEIFRDFTGYFPHKVHRQVIIAQNYSGSPDANDLGSIVRVSFNSIEVTSSPLKRITCAECHVNDSRVPVAIVAGSSEGAFTPPSGTFLKSPAAPAGHASCFGCHWETDEPKKDDCAGCHVTAENLHGRRSNPASINPLWFKDWPPDWPRRISLMFRHETNDHKEETCVSCHSNIMQAETLGLPDVSIKSCAQCHLKVTSRPSINKEMFQEDEDIAEGRNNKPTDTAGTNTCSGCHRSLIGSAPPPCSHYFLMGDRYFSVEDYPKSAKQLGERCKK